ncbi:MAG: hypothetical protein ACRDJO_08675 [Actinomycetota bacterium]
MKRTRCLLCLAATALALALPANPSHAAAETNAICHFEVHVVATPGWTMTPGTGSAEPVSPGRLDCTGTVQGSRISQAPGSFTNRYTYGTTLTAPLGGDTCALGAGEGRLELVVHTVNGRSVRLEGPFQWVGSAAFTLQGSLDGVPFTGAGLAVPEPDALDQNCLSRPLSRFVDTGWLLLGP